MVEIIRAQNELTNENCQSAIDILDAIEGEKSARWYQTKASAQACFSTFREISFFVSGIKNIAASSNDFGRSFASFDISSDMQASDDLNYTALLDAIETLQTAGDPTTLDFTGRSAIWEEEENTNMTLQAGYAGVAALGMYMNYYGNVNEDGEKGGGTGSNNCYLDYSNTFALAALAGLGTNASPCTGSGSGHPDLTPTGGGLLTGDTLTRACQGLVLFNSLFDFISNIPVPSDSGDLSQIDDIIGLRMTECESALANLGTLLGTTVDDRICTTTSIAECENIGTAEPERIEQYFVVTFEFLHRGP